MVSSVVLIFLEGLEGMSSGGSFLWGVPVWVGLEKRLGGICVCVVGFSCLKTSVLDFSGERCVRCN